MTTTGTIDYETLAQDAMRGVIAKILRMTEQQGLPGEHHFYISFDTNAPGVNISKRLRQQYPDVMTIVLQHRFWDLAVSDDRFEVKLTFDSIPERLVVPYAAIKVFFDPSVRYALQFDAPDIDGTGDTRAGPAQPGTMTARPTERSLTPVQPRPVATLDRPMRAAPALVPVDGSDDTNAADGSSEDEPHDVDVPADQDTVGFDQDIADTGSTVEPFRPRATERTVGEDDDPVTADAASEGDDIPPEDGDEDPEDQSAVVVSLDAFRKK